MTTDLLKPELSFLNNMDLPHKNVWAPFSNYTLQLHMDFHGFKWLISFCACSFQISIIMFIFLYRLTGGDDHADQRGKACRKCFCDTFDSDRCMNSLTRRWMSICSRSMVWGFVPMRVCIHDRIRTILNSTRSCRGRAVRASDFHTGVPGSSPGPAVAPLGKALYPHCLYSLSEETLSRRSRV